MKGFKHEKWNMKNQIKNDKWKIQLLKNTIFLYPPGTPPFLELGRTVRQSMRGTSSRKQILWIFVSYGKTEDKITENSNTPDRSERVGGFWKGKQRQTIR